MRADAKEPRASERTALPGSLSGCGAAWLARLTGGQEVAGSNPVSPTKLKQRFRLILRRFRQIGKSGVFLCWTAGSSIWFPYCARMPPIWRTNERPGRPDGPRAPARSSGVRVKNAGSGRLPLAVTRWVTKSARRWSVREATILRPPGTASATGYGCCGSARRGLRRFRQSPSTSKPGCRRSTSATTRESTTSGRSTDISPLLSAAFELFDLDYAKVETFYDNMPGSDAVKTRVRRVLHAALQRAVPKLISANPATGYRVKKKSRSSKLKRTAAWHPDDVRRFLRAAKSESRYYAMYLTAIATTMGPGELFGLQWKSVDLKNATLSVEHSLQDIRGALKLKEPKNESREREIALPPIVVEALREHEKKQRAEERREKRPTSSYVFTSPEGKPIRRGLFRTREWLPLLKKAKVPSVTMYGGMRHSANVLMIRLGASLLVASKRMGHSSTRMTTDVYGHVFTDEDRGVAETLNAFLGDI